MRALYRRIRTFNRLQAAACNSLGHPGTDGSRKAGAGVLSGSRTQWGFVVVAGGDLRIDVLGTRADTSAGRGCAGIRRIDLSICTAGGDGFRGPRSPAGGPSGRVGSRKCRDDSRCSRSPGAARPRPVGPSAAGEAGTAGRDPAPRTPSSRLQTGSFCPLSCAGEPRFTPTSGRKRLMIRTRIISRLRLWMPANQFAPPEYGCSGRDVEAIATRMSLTSAGNDFMPAALRIHLSDSPCRIAHSMDQGRSTVRRCVAGTDRRRAQRDRGTDGRTTHQSALPARIPPGRQHFFLSMNRAPALDDVLGPCNRASQQTRG